MYVIVFLHTLSINFYLAWLYCLIFLTEMVPTTMVVKGSSSFNSSQHSKSSKVRVWSQNSIFTIVYFNT